ncbi:MAG: 1,4-dihydroxy-6-naphthoate synthase [Desulfamplus sp.]|nr:1,4-dihydroxy-6-naphthoate synthase [Desulfamplus sp.]
MRNLTLAYSSCPNDTFIFNAIANNLLKTADSNIAFNITIADVETLNQYAIKSVFDITKLSFATFGALRDKYALLRTGAALGRGCGPLVVSLPKKATMFEKEILDKNISSLPKNSSLRKAPIKKTIVAVPGIGTTAFVLFSLFLKEHLPQIEPEIVPMPFEKIMPALKDGSVDLGVIIHEGRFTYQNFGLSCIVDLGEWWEKFTGLPIPLGCIAIKRDICEIIIKENIDAVELNSDSYEENRKERQRLASVVQSLIGQSIQYAFENPEDSKEYIKAHAQELDERVISQHINLYVNDFSKDIGTEGEKAICTFFQKAEEAGIIKPNNKPLFA